MASKVWVLNGVAVACAVALGGCATSGGGANMASLSPSVPAVASLPVEPAAPVIPVNYGSFLGGTAGSRLPDADRTAALGAENGAIASGERRTWKGAKGVFGYVVPNPTTSDAGAVPSPTGTPSECRGFTSTIFFAGRPLTGHGTGCRDADGSWHVTS